MGKIARTQEANTLQMPLNTVQVGDSRTATKKIPDESISVTITSPPYFDLKDYGIPEQIGFGQQYDEYLNDLQTIFAEVFRATRADGSLWIIVDTFRKDQEVLPLPFDLAQRLKTVGWTLRDIIIWKKERTLPWTHSGTTRKIFEYVLVFSKGPRAFKYDPDKYRDTSDLKRWWVRYPERYNPKGKSLEEIWSYDIPTQGSWGDQYIRHFCPLPSDLVSRIIQLTTDTNGVVLDPFSGSGTVPTVSAALGRSYIGIELNPSYVAMFEKHLAKEKEKSAPPKSKNILAIDSESFEEKIINLRILKYGRLVIRAIRKIPLCASAKIYTYLLPRKTTERFKHFFSEYVIVVPPEYNSDVLNALLQDISTKPPLSKFGIQAQFTVIKSKSDVSPARRKQIYYEYSISNSHFHAGQSNFATSWDSKSPLYSPIKLEVEEPDG